MPKKISVAENNEKLFNPFSFDTKTKQKRKKKPTTIQSKNDVDGALNKYKLIDAESQKGAEIWNNVGLCFYKKKKFIAVFQTFDYIFDGKQNRKKRKKKNDGIRFITI